MINKDLVYELIEAVRAAADFHCPGCGKVYGDVVVSEPDNTDCTTRYRYDHHDKCYYIRLVKKAEKEWKRLTGIKDPAIQRESGWSPAYKDVLHLRMESDRLAVEVERLISLLGALP